MQLIPHEIHIWAIHLAITPEKEQQYQSFLSTEEDARAKRFQSPLHKKRFIAAHGFLHQVIGLYLNQAPNQIVFHYNHYKKPHLAENPLALQFNMAHSHDLAVYAVTKKDALGIDIEKMKKIDYEGISRRYFSKEEKKALSSLQDQEKLQAFYRLWSRKEAIMKALGKGLTIPLSSFSVSIHNEIETILVENKAWTLSPLFIQSDYASALASEGDIETISFWQIFDHIPRKIKAMKL